MEKLARFFWKISIAVFTVVFLYVYAYLGVKVGINYNEYGVITDSISKEQFFYFGIALFAIMNILLWSIGKVFLKSNAADRDWLFDFKDKVKAWVISFAAAINIFLITVLAYIFMVNMQDGLSADRHGWVIYVGLTFVLLWAALFFVLLAQKMKGRKTSKAKES